MCHVYKYATSHASVGSILEPLLTVAILKASLGNQDLWVINVIRERKTNNCIEIIFTQGKLHLRFLKDSKMNGYVSHSTFEQFNAVRVTSYRF